MRVLIVDDHRVLAELLAAALSDREDVTVVGTASSGTEAVGMARSLRPDVVLLDYDLPDTDGISLVEPIRAVAPNARVLMLTSYTDSAILNDAMDARVAGFVTKRNGTEEIVAAVLAADRDQTPVSPDMVQTLVNRQPAGPAAALTDREMEVLRIAAEGHTNREIAEQLFISVNTVRNHMQRVLNKLDAHSKLEATAIAARLGIVRR